MMAELYIVKGRTGEHSDLETWNVQGFIELRDALEFAHDLNQYCIQNKVHTSNVSQKKFNSRKKIIENCRLDPNIDIDYTGTEYQVDGPLPLHLGGCILS